MGLDGVELLMALEEAFGVTMSDAEAEASVTPAAVIDLIFGKLRVSNETICVSQGAFYLLRKGLLQTLGVPRRSVKLNADIRSFARTKADGEVWCQLKAVVHARSWPSLVRPRWVVVGLWLWALAIFCAVITAFPWYIATVCAGVFAFGCLHTTRQFRSHIPARYSRVRQLVPYAATSDGVSWTRGQVASQVKKLVMEHLGLREEQYREDAYFVEDLGMDR